MSCSVLQSVAACCNLAKGFGGQIQGSMLQCVAVCCSVLQRVAACCSVQERASEMMMIAFIITLGEIM